MANFYLLSEEEYRRICSVIPHKIIINYFQKNPKEFSKIRPGFRASALQVKDAIRLLINYRERGFISSFIEGITKDWLEQIQVTVQSYQDNGESEITSYIHALYQSYFSDNISAYFKLIGKDYDEERLSMISGLVNLLKSCDEKRHDIEMSLSEMEEKVRFSERHREKAEKTIEKLNKQLADITTKLNAVRSIQAQYQEILSSYEKIKKEKETAFLRVDLLTQQIADLEKTIKFLQKEKEELETTMRAKLEEERMSLQEITSCPLAPVSMSEFIEYFSYNLESIGVPNSELPIRTQLATYVSKTVFQGKPIICNRNNVGTLARCIANTLTGSSSVRSIAFSTVLDKKQIYTAINNSGRIVILDNFLGNCNETILLSILNKFKSKMIFLSVTYEKTLFYLPQEFLMYCNYINLSHIIEFIGEKQPDEDPSILEEKELDQAEIPSKNRHQDVVRTVAQELGFSRQLSDRIATFAYDDMSACATLVFYAIPYLEEVLGEKAFNVSEALQRYADRSPYKKLFEEWFQT